MLSLQGWGFVHAGQANLALHEGRDLDVETHCDWLHRNSSSFGGDALLLATADSVLGRSRKRRAIYDSAANLMHSAAERFDSIGLPGLVAAVRVGESWLWMQVGEPAKSEECRTAAWNYLVKTEDWTMLANMRLMDARLLCRAGREEEGLSTLHEAIELYQKSQPAHPSVVRALTETANLELRIASASVGKNAARAKALRASAAANIKRAEAIAKGGNCGPRNWARLLRSQANQSIHGANPSLPNARRFARQCYEFARRHQDGLMEARSLYKQGVIEYLAAKSFEGCENPVQTLVRACQYATDALAQAEQMCNARLTARIRTLRGNIFLEFPFSDVGAATEEWHAAIDLMAKHENLDYVVQEIHALGKRLDLPVWTARVE